MNIKNPILLIIAGILIVAAILTFAAIFGFTVFELSTSSQIHQEQLITGPHL